jgi:hypothetical protein
VITDWTFGKIDDDYGLSKNISLGWYELKE